MRRWWRWLPLLLVALFLIAAFAHPAYARLGGGESFGGGGSSSGGGGSSSGDDFVLDIILIIIEILWDLCVNYPKIGIPLTLSLIAGVVWFARANSSVESRKDLILRTTISSKGPSQGQSWRATRRDAREQLVALDPAFSEPLFLDFAVLLYVRALDACGRQNMDPLRPYLSPEALGKLRRPSEAVGIEDVCVGEVRIDNILVGSPNVQIDVWFEASFQLVHANGTRRAQYSREVWTLERDRATVSKPPEEIATFGCPSCGNTGELRANGTCPSCDQVVRPGRFHWSVFDVTVIERRDPRLDEVTSGGGDEVGVGSPTVVDPRLAAETRALLARYPGFSLESFRELVTKKFLVLQDAWTKRDLSLARPHETDALFQTHRYWIERYEKAGITNVLEDVKVLRIETAKIDRDAFFESITVRIFAAMKDWKKDASGKLIAGDATRLRRFSEYWTFVRRQGFDPQAPSGEDAGQHCPSCGAPVQVSMAGVCEHCDAKVTSGAFGWVLARIEQDEVYKG